MNDFSAEQDLTIDASRKMGVFNALLSGFDEDMTEWRCQADDAWKEFRAGREYNRKRTKSRQRRYPLWFSTTKIRQPLIFSRVPDTVTQPVLEESDGGHISRVCTVTDKLAHAIKESFPYFRVMSAARDDVIQASVGVTRVMFSAEFEEVPEKIFLQEQEIESQDPQTGEPSITTQLVTPSGDVVPPELVNQDQLGSFYIESEEKTVRARKERVSLKHVSYKKFKWDHEASEYSDWEWIAFVDEMTTRQITKRFGKEALTKLAPQDKGRSDPKKVRRKHKIVELWYKPDRTRYIFAEGAADFIAEDEDPYGLEGFFPLPYPLFDNLDSDCTIPATEYEQVRDILSNIHMIFGDMAEALRLARPRALYDSSVPELSVLISKGRQGEYIGVPHLSTKVSQGQTLVLHLDTGPVLQAIQEYYKAFDREFAAYDQITGFSDLVRGSITNAYESATATDGKIQFVKNRVSLLQQDMQRFCKDGDEILVDTALGMFSEERIYEMLEPALDADEKNDWPMIYQTLKSDFKRSMRIDIETDSTILLDQEQQKGAVLELAQVLGGYLSQLAQITQGQPELTEIASKLLIQIVRKLRGGRAFQDEIVRAVQGLVQKAQQQAQQQQPNPEQVKAQIEQQKLALKSQELQIKGAQAQLEGMVEQFKLQLDARKLGLDEADQDFDQFMRKAELELKQVIESLAIREKFIEEQRLANQQNTPDIVVVPPEQTNTFVVPDAGFQNEPPLPPMMRF